MVTKTEITRKEVRNILASFGLTNRFSLKTIGFESLGYTSAQQVTIKDTILHPIYLDAYLAVKKELNALGVLCQRDHECAPFA